MSPYLENYHWCFIFWVKFPAKTLLWHLEAILTLVELVMAVHYNRLQCNWNALSWISNYWFTLVMALHYNWLQCNALWLQIANHWQVLQCIVYIVYWVTWPLDSHWSWRFPVTCTAQDEMNKMHCMIWKAKHYKVSQWTRLTLLSGMRWIALSFKAWTSFDMN